MIDGFVPSGLRIEYVVSHRHIDTEPCASEPADRAMYDEYEIAGNTENLDEERFCCEALIVAAHHSLDSRVNERAVNAIDFRAWHAEHVLSALDLKIGDEDLCTTSAHRSCPCSVALISATRLRRKCRQVRAYADRLKLLCSVPFTVVVS
jgi:hypothetical protein